MENNKILTSYSMWSAFRNCRKLCEWRYVREIAPRQEDAPALQFGKVIHECLALWHQHQDLPEVLAFIGETYAAREIDAAQRRDWHIASAMMQGYADRYPTESFEVVAVEQKFEGEIRNPATEALSRSFTLGGKVDAIVRENGQHFLVEHKTTSQISAGYLEQLWTDFQIALYSYYLEQTTGAQIAGVIYNILVKPKLQQSAGESEEEFGLRQHALIAKSKSGKSSAKRRMPETDEEFQARLAARMAEQGSYHRELLYLSKDRIDLLRTELWELTQVFLDARRRKVFYQNTSYCYHYNRPCGYFPLCRAKGSQLVIDTLYEHREPHEELREDVPASEPVF